MTVLEIKNLKFGYKENLILKDINLSMEKGDFVSISGANGSGKSTLVKLILGALKKDSGSILIDGTPIESFDNFEKIGYVPQLAEANRISFPITCKEYVILNLYKDFNIFNRPTKECYRKVDNVFTTLDIENLKDRPINELSGGQAQRVMIARAMVNAPDILILDEPTVGIDQKNKEDFMHLLAHLNSNHNITILIISHEMDIIDEYVSRNIFLNEGRLVNA